MNRETPPPSAKEQLRQRILGGFYRAFEDRFRGSRDVIRRRLEVYLPVIEPLKQLRDRPCAVDLGCGRGEWLELLRDNGFEARGVDLDEQMLSACHERGLVASKGDAVEFLERLPDASCDIVSGFHIAEHLPFPQLQVLIYEALRVLRSGGLLILETPNPENIKVSTLTFHLDPTHRSPIPPALLAFLTEYFGFLHTEIVRLQEDSGIRNSETASLQDVLAGVSPDYAVIAQKTFDEAHRQFFTGAFREPIGLDQEILLKRFDRQLLAQAQQVFDLKEDYERTLQEERRTIADLNARLVEERNAVAVLEGQVAAMNASLSWRLTKPFRLFSGTCRHLGQAPTAWIFKLGSRSRRLARSTFAFLSRYVRSNPYLAPIAKRVLSYLPLAIKTRLWVVAFNAPPMVSDSTPLQITDLSPRAREIHAMLEAAIEGHGKAS